MLSVSCASLVRNTPFTLSEKPLAVKGASKTALRTVNASPRHGCSNSSRGQGISRQSSNNRSYAFGDQAVDGIECNAIPAAPLEFKGVTRLPPVHAHFEIARCTAKAHFRLDGELTVVNLFNQRVEVQKQVDQRISRLNWRYARSEKCCRLEMETAVCGKGRRDINHSKSSAKHAGILH